MYIPVSMKKLGLITVSFLVSFLFVKAVFVFSSYNGYCEKSVSEAITAYMSNIPANENTGKHYVRTANGIVGFNELNKDVEVKLGNQNFLILQDCANLFPFIYKYNLLIISEGKVQSQINFFMCSFKTPLI